MIRIVLIDYKNQFNSRAVGNRLTPLPPAEVMENLVIPDIPCKAAKPSNGTLEDPLTNCNS